MFDIDNLSLRLNTFRNKLKDLKIDGALITKRENYMYLSGFSGSSANLLITDKKAYLLTDFRYVEQAAKQAPLFEIVQHKSNILDTIYEIVNSEGIKKLGFEDQSVTYCQYKEYSEKLKNTELFSIGSVVDDLRAIKDEQEIEIINKAVEIADKAFEQVLKIIKPGITELDVAAELEYKMKKLGASGASFETIVASGIRSSMPHGIASEKKLELGDTITMDFGAMYNHYCSDMTRTVFLGQPKVEMIEIYKIVLNAQLTSEKGAIKGRTGKEVDKIARDIIYRNGYEGKFGHGLGHGLGLEIHESPRLSVGGDKVLENNMAVTIEPGIYVEGLGGVRIEDTIIIRDDNPRVLTKSAKEIIIL
ncbi:aminopeptidase P family protein [Ruminiclostridium herbifermentans]|uniref:Aminopeptidase P family protein n=1 Tax=Ruminiclostridium herbifermentans TaxID=2488810 RepID=A0A4U7JJU7_9FIRM|nr:Xaa-Pro peptidase family protein [Ruminiclostridium herbifermentans]QNU65531.1 aminopeptidase P family protein [Ruminiclostridium herbifermentans]